MDPDTLRSELEETGELMVAVDPFEAPLELHLHDTEIGSDSVAIDLADGELTFELDAIGGYWRHKHSLADYGLE